MEELLGKNCEVDKLMKIFRDIELFEDILKHYEDNVDDEELSVFYN